MNLKRHYINNCLFKPKLSETGALFSFDSKGFCTVTMDGYAVIPIEEYRELTKSKTEEKDEVGTTRSI